MSKNNKKLLNERTHNPFNTYKELHRNTTSHNHNPEDNTAEFAEEFDAKLKIKTIKRITIKINNPIKPNISV